MYACIFDSASTLHLGKQLQYNFGEYFPSHQSTTASTQAIKQAPQYTNYTFYGSANELKPTRTQQTTEIIKFKIKKGKIFKQNEALQNEKTNVKKLFCFYNEEDKNRK